MEKQKDTKPVAPVMRKLARLMSKEELETVAGAPGGCAPSTTRNGDDRQF